METINDFKKHLLYPASFRRHRLPLMFLAMLPSFFLDGLFIYSILTPTTFYLLPTEINTFSELLSPFAANFLLLKAPAIYYYAKLKAQRLESYILVGKNQVIYRRNKRAPFAKIDYGYTYHDYIHFLEIKSVYRKTSGAIVVQGKIIIERKLPGYEMTSNKWIKSKFVIPPYFSDTDSIYNTLSKLMKNQI